MLSNDEVELLNGAIQDMDRDAVADRLRTFQGSFPIDFDANFYASQSLGRLRHILFGLCLHKQKMIELRAVA